MLKLVGFYCFLLATCSATHFLFGVEVKCALDDVFSVTVSHWEDDDERYYQSDDQISDRDEIATAYKKIFLYQRGKQDEEYGDSFEPFGHFYHNCTKDREFVVYQKRLPDTPKEHGLEYMEYSVDLTDARGEL